MNRIILPGVLLAAAIAVAAYVNIEETSVEPASTQVEQRAPTAQTSATPAEVGVVEQGPVPDNPVAVTPSAAVATEEMPTDLTTGVFPVDANGQLVLNQQTRLSLEAVLARTDPARLDDAKRELEQTLPPQAAAQAVELLDRYNEYQTAQKHAYPPGRQPATPEEALADLDGLHALRVAHFGAATADAFYGEEEKISRQLVELMRLEKDESLTLEEKAERAQQKLSEMPELSALNQANRANSKED